MRSSSIFQRTAGDGSVAGPDGIRLGRGIANDRRRRAGLLALVVATAALVGELGPTTAWAEPPAKPATASPAVRSAGNANELVVSYLAAWNERDGRKRRELIAKTWTATGTYIDAHRHGEGIDGIDAMIKAAQDRFPGYALHLVSGIEAHNGFFRFSWAAGGTSEAPLYLAGTDFATIASDGRLQQVAGFVDAAPAH